MIDLSPETEALARRLAAAEHRTVDETIRQALEAREGPARSPASARGIPSTEIAARRQAIEYFVRRVAAAPILDSRTPREIVDDLDPL